MRSGMMGFVTTVCAVFLLAACEEPHMPQPISSEASNAPAFIGHVATANPVPGWVTQNPFLADKGRAAMHSDGASSDMHPGPGPLGRNPRIVSRQGTQMPGGQCAIQTFARDGKLVVLCASVVSFTLQLLEPKTLELLAIYKMPSRPSTFHALVTLDTDKIMSDTSGAYFYLDAKDRVVIADAEKQVRRVGHRKNAAGQWEFFDVGRWDLTKVVPNDCFSATNWFPQGECDTITAVMPDAKGLVWWVTREGRVGTLNMKSGALKLIRLKGEHIQNGFSAATDGVYIASDHAMYRFEARPDGTPKIGWRETYQRSSVRKPGSIDQGTGTTPTLLGERYVALTDNADGQINLLVLRREQGFAGKRLVCKMPLFTKAGAAAENSPIGWGRSIIVENNYGYKNALMQTDWSTIPGGVTRIDIREDESGCDVVWHSKEKVPSVVAKLSAAAGLAYYYSFALQPDGKTAWYLTALDFATGKTMFKIRTGVGSGFDNNWSAMSLGLDGTAYVGLFKGLVAISDGPE